MDGINIPEAGTVPAYEMLIGGERSDGDALVSTDPGNPDRVVATAPKATPADAARAVEVAAAAAGAWAATPAVTTSCAPRSTSAIDASS